MNILHIYYTSILGFIRFLGIGVGNEHARASAIFCITILQFIAIIIKIFGYDIRDLGMFIIVILILSTFLIPYFFFSKKRTLETVNHWLRKTTKKTKITIGTVSFVYLLTSTIIFLRLYA